MTVSVEVVVARLRAAAERLDRLTTTAVHAQADIREALRSYTDAGQGSSRDEIRSAVGAVQQAGNHVGDLGQAANSAATALNRYINLIAPGSVATDKASEQALPSGEELVAGSEERDARRANVAGFLSRMVRKTEDLQENATKTTEAVQKAINALRGPSGGKTTTGSPSAPPAAPSTINASEAAGNLVVVGLLTGVAVHRAGVIIRHRIARLRNRDHDKCSDRPDPGTGAA